MSRSHPPQLDRAGLPRLARAFLQQHFETSPSSKTSPSALDPSALEARWLQETQWLQEPGATFVTLRKGGMLRGCIGSLKVHRPLLDDLRSNTIAAATRDPRFPAVEPSELDELTLEVSVLTAPTPLDLSQSPDNPITDPESRAHHLLRPGIDGVVLTWQDHRATFLPQVWEQLPTAERFLRELKKKADLPEDFWADDLQLEIYQVEKWVEDESPEA